MARILMSMQTLPAFRGLTIGALAVLVSACADIPTTPSSGTSLRSVSPVTAFARGGKRATDHAVIETKGASSNDFEAAVAALGGQIERRLPQVNFVVVRGLSASALESLRSRSDIASATADVRIRWIPSSAALQKVAASRHTTFTPGPDQSDAFFYDVWQWNMRVTKANEAWTTTPGGRNATVYVLDTGVDPTHGDLVGVVDVAKSRSFAENEPDDILDREAHGTFVSAIIASNGIFVASVAPLAKIVAVKVLDASGTGSFADVIAGIIYAADQGADVINMSLGAYLDRTDPDQGALLADIQAAVAYARFKGSVVIAAAGNDGFDLIRDLLPEFIEVPGELAGVISVGATAPVNQKQFDRIATYSNFGFDGADFAGGVALFAPGGDFVKHSVLQDLILSACSQYSAFGCGPFDYLIGAGTSFAAPMVSGEAAVNRSILGGPRSASDRNVECILEGTDKIGPEKFFGNGRINVVKSAVCARGQKKGIAD